MDKLKQVLRLSNTYAFSIEHTRWIMDVTLDVTFYRACCEVSFQLATREVPVIATRWRVGSGSLCSGHCHQMVGLERKSSIRPFSTAQATQWTSSYNHTSYHCRQRVGWWWKSSIIPFSQSKLYTELLHCTLVIAIVMGLCKHLFMWWCHRVMVL